MNFIHILTEEFVNNKYLKWYMNIIINAKSKNRCKSECYYENHHILPKSIFPEYGVRRKEFNWNLVLLKTKEHFIVHWLLTKCCKNDVHKNKMKFALSKMRRSKNNERIYTSLEYSIIRKNHSEAVSVIKKGIEPWNKGKTKDNDLRVNKMSKSISESMKSVEPWNKGKIGMQEAWNKGLTYKSGPRKEGSGKNISEAKKKAPRIECIFCGKITDPANNKKYHNDNCKFNPNIDPEIIERRSILAKENVEKQKQKGTFKSTQERMKEKGLDPHKHNHKIHECPTCGRQGKQPGIYNHIRSCASMHSHSSSV